MIIAGYLKTSLIEWPGKISSVIFTQGCNFRCGFCHNSELVLGYKKHRGNREHGGEIEERVVLGDIKKRKKWVDGVVITGGEPTLQEGLSEFLGKLHGLGFLTMVETNGSKSEVIAKLIGDQLVDYWTMDVKCNFDGYGGVVGGGGSGEELVTRIKESMGLIANSGVEYEFRTTVVPGIHDLENLKVLAREIRGIWEIGERRGRRVEPKWFLQQFRPVNCLDRSYLKKKGFTKEEMEGFLKEVKKVVPNTHLRGV